ncbi:MAG: cytochrome c biogenesis protein ResB [Tissierellia bacterium]|nr:cytochrome c biogenesis protein ResB [Tissierellia bacterium]
MLKRFTNFLTSLKFGIILFIIIAVYSIIGTVIPQGMDMQFYLNQYQTFGSLMVFLQFDQVYSSVIYLVIVFVFIINLVGCTLKILPLQLKKMKDYIPNKGKNNENLYENWMDIEDIKRGFSKRGFKVIDREEGSYAVKHRIGHIGSSVTHLGIVIIILGALIGNMFVKEGYITLAPGEVYVFDEDGFTFRLNDFYLDLREDGSVEQYYSELTVYEDEKEPREEMIWVNNPLNINGMYFYQSDYGWASKMQITCADGHVHQESIIKENPHAFYEPEDLTVFLYGYFPDFSMDMHGNPVTLSQNVRNPAYAVVLYNEEGYVDSYIVEPGQPIKYKDIVITFVDSVLYTGLTYRQDFGYYPVLIGSIVLTLGILLSFYFYPKYILISPDEIIPVTRQNVWGFTIKIKKILEELNKVRGNNQ